VKEKLNRSFENLLKLLRGLGKDGTVLAEKANARFKFYFCFLLEY
jgi:hypothetical protein